MTFKIIQALPKDIYINLFSNYDYYLQKELKVFYFDQYTKIVEREPVLADIESIAKTIPISKINIYAKMKEKIEIEKILSIFRIFSEVEYSSIYISYKNIKSYCERSFKACWS